MKNNTNRQQIARSFLRIAQITALGLAFAVALPLTAHAQIVTPPVPTDLEVPATDEAFLLGRGVGTQNYICQPAASLGRVAWTLFTPQATLFSDDAEQLTTHFFSPNPMSPASSSASRGSTPGIRAPSGRGCSSPPLSTPTRLPGSSSK
jgi:hypothetical protein